MEGGQEEKAPKREGQADTGMVRSPGEVYDKYALMYFFFFWWAT